MILIDHSSNHSMIRVLIHSLAHLTSLLRQVHLSNVCSLLFTPLPTHTYHPSDHPSLSLPLFYRRLLHLPHRPEQPCEQPTNQQVMSGEVHDRLIPIPYSKTSTDQAVRECETQRQHSTLLRSPTVLLLCSCCLGILSLSYRIIVSLDRSFFSVAVGFLSDNFVLRTIRVLPGVAAQTSVQCCFAAVV